MGTSNFEKCAMAFLGGAVVGAALGILFAPDKGSVTRGKISNKAKELSNDVNGKIADLKGRAEELIDEIKDVAEILTNNTEEEA